MLDTFLVNWSGQLIPTDEMMVMRRVAVQMRTIYEAKEVEFVHDICAEIVRYEKTGVFGAVGGLYFFGDFGAKNEQPNTVDFFIPRGALHHRGNIGVVVSQAIRFNGSRYESEGYPEDVDEKIAQGAGKLKITIRQEK